MTLSSSKLYGLTLLALFVLLAATIGLAYLDLGSLHLPVALFIATAKALLILAIFMDLRRESGIVILAAAAGFFWLAIFAGLTLSDYLTRT